MGRITTCVVIGFVCLLAGCASLRVSTDDADFVVRGNLHPGESSDCQFEYGQDAPVIDGLGNIVGIPRKLLLWNRRVKSHDVSQQTEDQLRQYVAVNDLHGVKVRINQYAPIKEWQRLRQNEHIHPVWKYTAGTLNMLGYTFLPGRVFGRDEYNPYTNTVNIYSDVASLGIAELAYAKDIEYSETPGLYAFSQEFAGLDVIHTSRSTKDAINYLAVHGSFDDLREGYCVLYPAMGVDVGDSVGSLVPQADFGLNLIGAAAGHVAGRKKARDLTPTVQPQTY